MKSAQIRSKKAVIRYQYVLMLAYSFCGMKVNDGKILIKTSRQEHKDAITTFRITYIFEQGRNGGDLADVYGVFKVA